MTSASNWGKHSGPTLQPCSHGGPYDSMSHECSQARSRACRQPQEQLAESAPADGGDLPDAWERHFDETHGEHYYWNRVTKEPGWPLMCARRTVLSFHVCQGRGSVDIRKHIVEHPVLSQFSQTGHPNLHSCLVSYLPKAPTCPDNKRTKTSPPKQQQNPATQRVVADIWLFVLFVVIIVILLLGKERYFGVFASSSCLCCSTSSARHTSRKSEQRNNTQKYRGTPSQTKNSTCVLAEIVLFVFFCVF